MTTARTRTAAKARAKAVPRPRAEAAPEPAAEAALDAPPPGTADLAGGLRALLLSVETEVKAVSALSEQIDAHVTALNDLRDQQAKRLLVLDELRASVTDGSLGSFLDGAIKPRRTRVREVVPERLS